MLLRKLLKRYTDGNVYGVISVYGLEPFILWIPGVWQSLCLVSSQIERNLQFFVDGRLVLNVDNPKIRIVHNFHKNITGNIRLLVNPDIREETATNVHNTDITDIQIWNVKKTPQFIEKLSICQTNEEGNILKWSESKIQTNLTIYEEVKLKDICKKSSMKVISYGERMDFTNTRKLCKNLGGDIAIASSKSNLDQMLAASRTAAQKSELCQSGFFTGYSDDKEEGKWTDIVEGNTMIYNAVTYNDNSLHKNCVAYEFENTIVSRLCSNIYCPICNITSHQTFHLENILGSNVDNYYVMLNTSFLLGLKKSKMMKTKEGQWQIKNENTTVAKLTNKNKEYNPYFPIGSHDWIFLEQGCTSTLCSTNLTSNFHIAVERPGNFCCSDGSCFKTEDVVCNIIYDCEDKSDELFCHQRIVETGSNMQNINNSDYTGVSVKLEVFDILEISQEKSTFSLFFLMELQWKLFLYDHLFLNEDFRKNTLRHMTNKSIWTPKGRIFE